MARIILIRIMAALLTAPNNSFNRSGISLIFIVNLDAIRY